MYIFSRSAILAYPVQICMYVPPAWPPDGAHLMEVEARSDQDHGEPFILGGMKPGPRSTPLVCVRSVSIQGRGEEEEEEEEERDRDRSRKRRVAARREERLEKEGAAAAAPSQTTFPSKTKGFLIYPYYGV